MYGCWAIGLAVSWLTIAADLATILALIGAATAVVAYLQNRSQAKKRLLDHLEAHLAAIRAWSLAPSQKLGWERGDVTPLHLAQWSDVRTTMLAIGSAPSLFAVTLSESVSIRGNNLRRALVEMAQGIESFNTFREKIVRLQTGDPQLAALVAMKLDPILNDPEFERKYKNLDVVYSAAKLTRPEWDWANMVASMSSSLHLNFLGNESQRGTLMYYVRKVEAELAQER